MKTTSILGLLGALVALTPTLPAAADEMQSPSLDEVAASTNADRPLPEPDAPAAPPGERHWHVGIGLVPLVWMPKNNPLTFRFELEARWTPSAAWSVVADLSYIQVGESGTRQDEYGYGLYAGGIREWAVGGSDESPARWFPHVRAGLVFEATSTRSDISSKHIAVRAGPGIDWNAFGSARLNLGLEIGLGLLALKNGSEGDSALAQLTLGLAFRILWGF